MVIPRRLSASPIRTAFRRAALCVAGTAVFAAAGHAQAMLVIQRGDGLFAADATGTGPARRIGGLASPTDSRWAVTPDGRRIAILNRTGVATAGGGMATRPAEVTLSERGGRHRKLLFTTANLRDRQGHVVASLGFGVDAGAFANWEPIGLSWSADSRTLYVSCKMIGGGGSATFAVDGASGLALVDGSERWKAIAPLVSIDVRGSLLLGTSPAASGDNADPIAARHGVLTTIDLESASTATPVATSGDPLPPDTLAIDPALSPDSRQIAFATAVGLFDIDRRSMSQHRIITGSVERPRWSPDGRSLYFLLARPGADPAAPAVYDLYAVDAPTAAVTGAPAPLRLVLQGADWFDIVPQ